jgi:hypothetical protein
VAGDVGSLVTLLTEIVGGGGLMTRVSCREAGAGVWLSCTIATTMKVPDSVGVPLMAPVAGLMLSPAGRLVALHVYGGSPPVAATVAPG